jgi:ribosomal protein S18 acetylase RimI-like enzyme
MEIRTFKNKDELDVVQLWRDCGLIMPHNNPVTDINRKLATQPDLFLVGVKNGRIIASIMAGYEGHRGWLNYLAVSADMRRRGIGRQMVLEAEKLLCSLGCPKINLQVRSSNVETIAFYLKIGFVEDEVISLGKRLEAD